MDLTAKERAREEGRQDRERRERERLAKNHYQPKGKIKGQLGDYITEQMLPAAEVVPGGRWKEVFLGYLPTFGRISSKEILYFETTELDLCTDGSVKGWGGVRPEDTHAYLTSLDHKLGSVGRDESPRAHAKDNRTTNANEIPYIVLPLPRVGTDRGWVGQDRGVQLGDVGVIVNKERVVYAQFVEAGPFDKLGEASIEVLRLFGADRMAGRKGRSVLDAGLDDAGPFVTLVFPGSGNGRRLWPVEIAARAGLLFHKLGGMPYRK